MTARRSPARRAPTPRPRWSKSAARSATRGSARVTPGLFTLLGNTQPIRGRLFDAGEGGAGTDDRVVLSEDLWRTLYGADPAILNQRITIDNEALIVVGILPSEFRFPQSDTVIWRPINYDAPPPARQADRPTAYVRFAPSLPREEAIRLATDAAHAADGTTAKLYPQANPWLDSNSMTTRNAPFRCWPAPSSWCSWSCAPTSAACCCRG